MTAADDRDALAATFLDTTYAGFGYPPPDPTVVMVVHDPNFHLCETALKHADTVLASDWLAARDRRVAAEALREAVAECDQWGSGGLVTLAWLSQRADKMERKAGR
jgi:hypothetical protein